MRRMEKLFWRAFILGFGVFYLGCVAGLFALVTAQLFAANTVLDFTWSCALAGAALGVSSVLPYFVASSLNYPGRSSRHVG